MSEDYDIHMITRDIIRDFLRSKEVYQMTSIAPIERKSYNWTVVKNRCIKWQIDSVYLGNYLKSKLGWKKKKKNNPAKLNEIEDGVKPNTHGIMMENGKMFVVYIYPETEWINKKPKIHYMNTEHKDWKTATYRYTYIDTKDNKEIWKKTKKDYKSLDEITTHIDLIMILMSGFNLTKTNKLRADTKKELTYRLTHPQKRQPRKRHRKEPKEYTYLLTIIDLFSKYAWVFPLETHSGVEVAILLHELFSRGAQYKTKLSLSDIGSELKNPHTNFVCKHNEVFQIYALARRPLGIIERFNQTFKRKITKAIYEGRMTKYNFIEMIRILTTEYNTTIHSTTRYKPAVAHFTINPKVAENIHKRLQSN